MDKEKAAIEWIDSKLKENSKPFKVVYLRTGPDGGESWEHEGYDTEEDARKFLDALLVAGHLIGFIAGTGAIHRRLNVDDVFGLKEAFIAGFEANQSGWVTVDTKLNLRQFKQRLRAIRILMGLSGGQLARKCALSGTTISNWESGRHEPSVRQIAVLAEALGVPVSALVSKEFRIQAR